MFIITKQGDWFPGIKEIKFLIPKTEDKGQSSYKSKGDS